VITFKKVNKSFQEDFWKKPKHVLKDFSFNLSEGSLSGFLGANGAGKTTSIKAMLGFISIDSGEINFSEKLGDNFKLIRGQIGYFPEAPYFYPFLTGREFCLYLGKLQGISASVADANMKKWGQKLNIDYALDKKVRGYSKGMLQRLGFLSALIHDPKLIILDEPLSGLDPIGRKEFKDVLITLNKEGKTIFFSSHIVSDVEEICNELVVIKEGELFYSGRTSKLLEKNNQGLYSATIEGNVHEIPEELFVDRSLLPGGYTKLTLGLESKDPLLRWITENNTKLHELKLDTPSLEQVIYESKE